MEERLDGWKAIAKYLNASVKTGQRLETKHHLPIERSVGINPRVHATKWRLDEWMAANGRSIAFVGSAPPESESMEAKLIEQESPTKLLQLYYRDDALIAQGLFRFSYLVAGKRVVTNMATSDSWLGFALPINEYASDKFPLRKRSFSWPATPRRELEMLRAEMKRRDIPFHNNPIYCLQSFTPHNPQEIASFSVGQYIDYKIRLGQLEEEIIRALVHCSGDYKLAYLKRDSLMPLRRDLLPDCATIANFGNRLCPGGTNILLALRKPRQKGFVFFVKRRSRRVSTGRKRFSLLPSGMHQPATRANAKDESSPASTVFRETYEELFDGEEVEAQDNHIAPHWYMSKPQLAWFRNNPKKFTQEVVSFGLNLVDGTYEFGVLLVVNDEQYWEEHSATMVPCKEFRDSRTPAYSTLDRARLASVMTNPLCAGTSLIVIIEGLNRLRHLYPSEVNLPGIQQVRYG